MRLLIIDTATEALSVALFEQGELIARHHEITGRGHAEKLIPAIAAMPDGGRAAEIWVDRGPGSFTGIRVGMAAAKALSYAWRARIRSYSSLSLVAAMARETLTRHDMPIFATLTGGHGELFWQMFDAASLSPQNSPASTPIAQLAREVDLPLAFGTGARVLIEARGIGEAKEIHPDASLAPLLASAGLIEDIALPLYGRGADAKPAAPKGQPS